MRSPDPLTPGRVVVSGAPEGYDAKLLADTVARADGPVLHVARDDTRVAALRAGLGFFAPDLPVLIFPAWDCLPYDRISPNAEIAAARMATLAALAGGFDRPAVLLTTLNAATQRVPARSTVRCRVLHRQSRGARRCRRLRAISRGWASRRRRR
jgi:transcription-repair coupling factor (superfamily II helicase)